MSVIVPNIFTNPSVKPPFPPWDATTQYITGDCVWYGGQNYIAVVAGVVPLNARPDLRQITSKGLGIYSSVEGNGIALNLIGGVWLNMTLATPPAMPYSPLPSVPYATGTAVMYPPGSYKYWKANQASVFNETPANAVSNQPNNISNGIVRSQQLPNLVLPAPSWSNFINSVTNVPVPFFPPKAAIQTVAPPTTGVQGPTQYWAPTPPLTGLPAVPQAVLVP